jgi:hypothetical protein
MAFKYYSTSTIPLPPYDFKAAKAGTYEMGQIVELDTGTGLIAPLTTPMTTAAGIVCMHRGTIETDGELIPTSELVPAPLAEYETELTAAVPALAVGSALEISASGLGVDGTALGPFIVSSFSGTAAGDIVRGRFSFVGPQGPTGATGA